MSDALVLAWQMALTVAGIVSLAGVTVLLLETIRTLIRKQRYRR